MFFKLLGNFPLLQGIFLGISPLNQVANFFLKNIINIPFHSYFISLQRYFFISKETICLLIFSFFFFSDETEHFFKIPKVIS